MKSVWDIEQQFEVENTVRTVQERDKRARPTTDGTSYEEKTVRRELSLKLSATALMHYAG